MYQVQTGHLSNLDQLKISRTALESLATTLVDSLGLALQDMRARDMIIEGAHAQMVIQNLHLVKVKEARHASTGQKKSDRTKLFPDGKGRHLTSNEFIEAVKQLEVNKSTKEAMKEWRKTVVELKRAAREANELEWKVINERYGQAVLVWKSECERLVSDEGRKRIFLGSQRGPSAVGMG